MKEKRVRERERERGASKLREESIACVAYIQLRVHVRMDGRIKQ
jgi:hypothetical protein